MKIIIRLIIIIKIKKKLKKNRTRNNIPNIELLKDDNISENNKLINFLKLY